MVKQKKTDETQEEKPVKALTFTFFKNEIDEEDGSVRAMLAPEIGNPAANRSGSFNLDFDLTVPFPEGRITEVYGEEGTCKTTLALEVAGRALEAGKTVLYINMEKNINLSLMMTVRTLRPYLDKAIDQMKNGGKGECPLWIVNASNGEQAFETMRKFASMMPRSVAILDSIDAAQPEAVLSGEIGENKVGNLAKLMSDAMRKLIGVAEQNKVAIICINQIRDKITMYGDPTDTPGGRAVKFYASQRIRLQKPGKAQTLTDAEGDRIGVVIRYKIVKNKVAPDGNEGEFPILFKNGIFREQELITKCCNFGILRLGGKGGAQVYLPKIDRKSGDFAMVDGQRDETCVNQFNAARRLLIDRALANKLEALLNEAISTNTSDPITGLTDEIQDTE